MSYVENNLLDNEKILYQSKIHWIVFVSPCVWILITLIIATQSRIFLPLAMVASILAVYYLISAFIRYKFSEYAVTDKRVLIKIGFISRESLEMFLQKIEGIQVRQNIPGRIFNYGTIIVIGTGGTPSFFPTIDEPLTFRKNVQAQIEKQLSARRV